MIYISIQAIIIIMTTCLVLGYLLCWALDKDKYREFIEKENSKQ